MLRCTSTRFYTRKPKLVSCFEFDKQTNLKLCDDLLGNYIFISPCFLAQATGRQTKSTKKTANARQNKYDFMDLDDGSDDEYGDDDDDDDRRKRRKKVDKEDYEDQVRICFNHLLYLLKSLKT